MSPPPQMWPLIIPGSSQPEAEHSFNLPGYREPEDEESNLTAVLDSLIPFIRGNDSSVKLPVYIGKLETVPETEKVNTVVKVQTSGRLGKSFPGQEV
jgi:hypothetical protein